MENKSPKFNQETEDKKNLDHYFMKVLEEANKNSLLKTLLEQEVRTSKELRGKSLFETIKERLLQCEGANNYKWNDYSYNHGQGKIFLNEDNKELVEKSFTIPYLNIQIEIGKIRDFYDVPAVSFIWHKINY